MRYEVIYTAENIARKVLETNDRVEAVKECKRIQDDIARRRVIGEERCEIKTVTE